MRYRSKPTTCEAWQLPDPAEISIVVLPKKMTLLLDEDDSPIYELWVEKSDAWCNVSAGDYVIAEPDGSGYYPCARAIFEARWELAPTIDQ